MAERGIHLKLDLPLYRTKGEKGMPDSQAGASRGFRSALEVVSFTCGEGINRLYRLELLVGLDLHEPGVKAGVDEFIGQAVRLAVVNETGASDYDNEEMARNGVASPEEFVDGSRRVFTGRIVEALHLGDHFAKGGDRPLKSFYHLVAVPDAWYLGRNRRTTSYVRPAGVKLTPKDVIEDLLSRYKEGKTGEKGRVVNYKIDIADDYVLKDGPRCVVQFRESDHDFLLRWLERQGWFYRFEPGEKDARADADGYSEEKMIISSSPKLERLGLGKSQFLRKVHGSAMKMGLYSFRASARQYPVQIALHDYNPDTPGADMSVAYPEQPRESGLPPLILDDEFYDTPAEGKALAQVRMETYEANAEVFEGGANVPGMAPGLSFLLQADAGAEERQSISKGAFDSEWMDKSYFITGAEHSATSTRVDPAVVEAAKALYPALPPLGYTVNFTAVRFRPTYHPERTAAWPKITETVSAVTLSMLPAEGEVAVDVFGKYYVWIPGTTPFPEYAREPGSIGPVRAVQSDVEREGGAGAAIPPGYEVLLTFRDGNPDRPAISGSIPNSYTKTFHYPNTNGVGLDASGALNTILSANSAYSALSTTRAKCGEITTSIGGRTGKAGTFVAKSDGGSDDAYVLSTFLETKTLALDCSSAGMTSSKGLFANSLSVGNSTDNWSLVGIVEDLQKRMLQAKTVASQYTKIDYYADEGIVILNDITNKVTGTLKVMKALVKISAELLDKERLAITAAPGSAKVATRAIFTNTRDKLVNVVNISNQFVGELKKVHDYVTSTVKMGKELYGSEEIQRKAQQERMKKQKKKMGIDPNLLLPVSPYEKFHQTITHMDYWSHNIASLATVTKDFMMFVKLLKSICKADVGNSGIRIQASCRNVGKSAGKLAEMNAVQSVLNPPAKTVNFDKNKGLNLQILSDGPMRLKSEDTLYVAAYKDAQDPFTKEPKALSGKSIIQMGNDHAASDAERKEWKTSIRIVSGKVDMHGGTLSLTSGAGRTIVGSGVKAGQYAGLSFDRSGGFSLSASTASGTLWAPKGLHSVTNGDVSAVGGSLTLASTGVGIVLGFANKVSGAVDGAKPYIGLAAMSKSDVAKVLKAKAGVLEKEKAYTKSFLAWRAAKDGLGTRGERVAVLYDEYAKDGSPKTLLVYNRELAAFKVAATKESKAWQELKKAKAECDKAMAEVKRLKASPANKNLELTNGQGGKQSIVLSPKSVEVGSDKDVNLKAGGTKMAMSTSGGVKMQTSGAVKIKGSTVDIG